MCDPMIIGTAISAAGTLIGGIQQAQAYQARAAFSDRQAVMEGQRGAYESERVAEQNTAALDRMRGSFLSSGFALEGSPSQVIEDSASQASLDEQAIKYGARVKMDNLKFEAAQDRRNASSAVLGSFFNAAGTLVGGFSQMRDLNQRRTTLLNPYAVTYG